MDPPSPDANRNTARRLLLGIIVGVFAWGTYLAVGAVRANRARDDFRQGIVIFVCVSGFLVFWLGTLWFVRQRGLGRANRRLNSDNRWSVASPLGLFIAFVGAGLFGATFSTGLETQVALRATLGWISLGLFGVAMVLALVGLSDPRPLTGKWLGLFVFLLFVVMTVVWLAASSALQRDRERPDERVRSSLKTGYRQRVAGTERSEPPANGGLGAHFVRPQPPNVGNDGEHPRKMSSKTRRKAER